MPLHEYLVSVGGGTEVDKLLSGFRSSALGEHHTHDRDRGIHLRRDFAHRVERELLGLCSGRMGLIQAARIDKGSVDSTFGGYDL